MVKTCKCQPKADLTELKTREKFEELNLIEE